MANAQQLEIIIKTVAQTAGITVTEQEVKKLTETLKQAEKETKAVDNSADALAKQFGEANRKAQEFGNSLKGLSEDQMAKVRDRLREQIQEQQLAGRSADELRQKLADTYGPKTTEQIDAMTGGVGRARAAADKLSTAKQTLGRAAQQTSTSMAGLQRAAGGLAQGGFAGLVNVVGGLTTALKGLAVGAMGAVLLPAIAAIGAALLAMRSRAQEAQKAMDEMWAEAGKNAKLYNDTLLAANEKTEASQKRQLENLGAIAAKYAELGSDTANADALADRRTEAQKKIDLAAARTPEERAAVEARYEEAALGTRESRATRDLTNSQRESSELRSQTDEAQRDVSEAQQKADDSLAAARDAAARAKEAGTALAEAQLAFEEASKGGATGFDEARKALLEAQINKDLADKESAELAKVALAAREAAKEALKKATETITKIRERMKEVELAAKEAETRLAEIDAERAVQGIEAGNAAQTTLNTGEQSIAVLEAERKAAADRNDQAGVNAANRKISEQVAANQGARAGVDAAQGARSRVQVTAKPTATPAREAGTITRGDETVTVRVGGNEPAQTGGVIRRNGEVVSDTRQLASTLEKASAAQQDRDRVIIKFAEDTTKSAETTKRQILNSRQKSQP